MAKERDSTGFTFTGPRKHERGTLANHADGLNSHYTAFTMSLRPTSRPVLSALTATLALALSPSLSACSGTTTPASGDAGTAEDAGIRSTETRIIDVGACKATIRTLPFMMSPHVSVGTAVEYNSNPPTSGPHYPLWAAFREYDQPVDRRYYVHDLEHGAVVLAYKCNSAAECPQLVEGLRKVVANIKTDPLCQSPVRVRYVLTPDPLLETQVAIAAWGTAYVADCLDVPTLSAFANDNYARGPENFCSDGVSTF